MDETIVDGFKAVALTIASLSCVSLAIILYWINLGGGIWTPHLGPHVYVEVSVIGVVGLCLFLWAGLHVGNIIIKLLALRRVKNEPIRS